ncbi:hypothetical protein OIU78_017119 [Salix suchowensis]|nr:hypothetical protein OIU78_017119 [Salix suchowensis]
MASNSANLWVLLGLGLAGIWLMTKKLKKSIIRQDFGAFIEKLLLLPPPQPPPPKAPHPLTALTFAVSDLFEIEGYLLLTGVLLASVKLLLMNLLIVFMEKISIMVHLPILLCLHEYLGGSCSGAAVAVAANLVDFSLGVDTVGGVRVPAGFCGVVGFRPSYGAISKIGVLPVSASLDTVGWFAKDPNILRRVGHVLLQPAFGGQRIPRKIIMADDCFQLLKIPVDRVSQVVVNSTEKHFGRQILKHEILDVYLNSKVPSLKEFHNKKTNGEVKTSSIRLLANVMQLLHRTVSFDCREMIRQGRGVRVVKAGSNSQQYEFRSNHEEWINTEKPILDPDFLAQMNEIMKTSDAEIELCKSIREEMRLAINSLLKDDGILVTVPLGYYDMCPVSVSLIARHGNDRFLLDTLQIMYASLQEQAETYVKSKSRNTDMQGNSAEMAKEKKWSVCQTAHEIQGLTLRCAD